MFSNKVIFCLNLYIIIYLFSSIPVIIYIVQTSANATEAIDVNCDLQRAAALHSLKHAVCTGTILTAL